LPFAFSEEGVIIVVFVKRAVSAWARNGRCFSIRQRNIIEERPIFFKA
jgi:hypothetical protein